MLSFDESLHIYRWRGNEVPSVTKILNEWLRVEHLGVYVNTWSGQTVPIPVFEDAADFGTAVHRACALIIDGTLDWDALAPELVGPCRQFEAWLLRYEVQAVLVEKPLYSKKYRFSGTPDIFGARVGNGLVLIDIKTGGFDLAGPQLAAYEQLLREDEEAQPMIRRHRKITRYVLHLPKDGSEYKYIPMSDAQDWPFFLSCLNRHNYLTGRK